MQPEASDEHDISGLEHQTLVLPRLGDGSTGAEDGDSDGSRLGDDDDCADGWELGSLVRRGTTQMLSSNTASDNGAQAEVKKPISFHEGRTDASSFAQIYDRIASLLSLLIP